MRDQRPPSGGLSRARARITFRRPRCPRTSNGPAGSPMRTVRLEDYWPFAAATIFRSSGGAPCAVVLVGVHAEDSSRPCPRQARRPSPGRSPSRSAGRRRSGGGRGRRSLESLGVQLRVVVGADDLAGHVAVPERGAGLRTDHEPVFCPECARVEFGYRTDEQADAP